MTSILVGISLIVIAMVIVAVRRGLQMRQLVENGVVTTGTVEKLWGYTVPTGTQKHHMRYSFHAENGHHYQKAILISPGERGRFQVGVQVTVIYLPDNPNISALADAVEQARKALKNKESL